MRARTRKLKVYGADLTHTYIALASGTFPLGLAYVASAVKKILGDEVEVELFRYPDDLDRSVRRAKPDVFLFSGYVWNRNLALAFAKKIKSAYPDVLIVGGGPDISKDVDTQRRFLEDTPYVDLWVLQEGEIATCHILQSYLEVGQNIDRLKERHLPSAISLAEDGSLRQNGLWHRLGVRRLQASDEENVEEPSWLSEFESLDDVPSPYLTGILDKFFDGRLYPLIETNRGCPFTCSFCQQGSSYFQKVAARRLDSCKEEFGYIARQMTARSPGISRVEIADPNFAMFPQDLEFCEYIREIQDEYDWPRFIGCSTGKNNPDRILNAVSKLMPDSLVVSNAMQSTNEQTLEAIKRKNISLDGYRKVQTEIHRRGLRSMADVILGLPLETKKSHFSAVYDLVDSGVQEFTSYQAMILRSSDLELKSYQDLYGLKTRWRLLPRAIGEYRMLDGNHGVPEIEEITVETNTLSYADYLDSRRLHLTTMIYHNSGVFALVHKYLEKHGVKPSQLVRHIYELSSAHSSPLQEVYAGFLRETEGELFATFDECFAFYSDPANIELVKQSKIGGNLLWKYLGVTLFEYWQSAIDVLMVALRDVVQADQASLDDIRSVLEVRVVKLGENERIQTDVLVPIKTQEIMELILANGNGREDVPLRDRHVTLVLDKNKYDTLVHALTVYPNDRTGRSLILAVHRVHTVIREFALSA